MGSPDHPASVILLMSLVFGVSDSIRTLKEGPMIDAEGREYKSLNFGDHSPPTHSGRPTVRVACTEVSMILYIKADFYNNGRLVSPQDLFLGDAKYSKSKQCQAVDAGDGEYVIEADLQECGSKLTIAADDLVYSNNLILSPPVGPLAITRMAEAVVPVSCHYKRTHTVSSAIHQQPLTYSVLSKFPLGTSPISLKLKTDDWLDEEYSNTVFLGDPLHLEASYTGLGKRKLFIDFCVATLSPDSTSVPRYAFIDNHGCFVDAKDGGLNSFFQPRLKPSSLRFQLDVFLFQNDLRNTIYLTCEFKATRQLWNSSPTSKVCNYMQSSWKNVDGNDSICQCCKNICKNQQPQDEVCDTLTLGPLIVIPRK